jgi:hypothetical protein
MQIDFRTITEPDNFVTVPEGLYLCRIAEVRSGVSRDGSERWSLRLVVDEGDHTGHTAAWDSLTWSEKGVYRVKRALEAFGFDVSGETCVEPGDLEGIQVRARLVHTTWEDPETGRRQERMTVPFLGYESAGEQASNGETSGSRGAAERGGVAVCDDSPF